MKYIFAILTALTLLAAPTALAGTDGSATTTELSQAICVTARAGMVEITNAGDCPAEVSIYAITGQQVKHCTAPAGTTAIELAPGCYIVRVNGLSRRVVIR